MALSRLTFAISAVGSTQGGSTLEDPGWRRIGRRSRREPGGAGDAGRLSASFLAERHAGSHPPVAEARAAARLP